MSIRSLGIMQKRLPTLDRECSRFDHFTLFTKYIVYNTHCSVVLTIFGLPFQIIVMALKGKLEFTKQMRKATREIHDISDALVNAKLGIGKRMCCLRSVIRAKF